MRSGLRKGVNTNEIICGGVVKDCKQCEKLKKQLAELVPLAKLGQARRDYNRVYAKEVRAKKRVAA